jgi:NTE family protein
VQKNTTRCLHEPRKGWRTSLRLQKFTLVSLAQCSLLLTLSTMHSHLLLTLLVTLLLGCAADVKKPPQDPVPNSTVPRLGLALGGGASRGFAHIGVIQVLEEAGIKPDLVVGTSAGSLVAAIYASGKTGKEMEGIALAMDEASLTDWTIPFVSRGLLRGEALARYVSVQVAGRLIEDMNTPLGIVATNFQTGEAVLFRKGDAATAVRASSAIPAVFTPVKIGSVEYVDGGLVSPVPVLQARSMGAQVVLAVDISSPPEGNATASTIDMVLQTTAIMGKAINSYALREADVVVRPALAGAKGTDFGAKAKTIEAGRLAMRAALPQLKLALQPR